MSGAVSIFVSSQSIEKPQRRAALRFLEKASDMAMYEVPRSFLMNGGWRPLAQAQVVGMKELVASLRVVSVFFMPSLDG
jgi:hypothetical protein